MAVADDYDEQRWVDGVEGDGCQCEISHRGHPGWIRGDPQYCRNPLSRLRSALGEHGGFRWPALFPTICDSCLTYQRPARPYQLPSAYAGEV